MDTNKVRKNKLKVKPLYFQNDFMENNLIYDRKVEIRTTLNYLQNFRD